MLGGTWQHLIPIGDPAYRLNLLSAVFSALVVGLAYGIFQDITGNRGAAIIAAMTFAASSTFWSQATESEVYSLNTLLLALLTWLALKWRASREFKYSAAWAFTFGLSLTHHRSIILLIPAFAALFAEAVYERARGYKSGGASSHAHRLFRDAAYSILIMLPLLLYLYIPLRASATPYAKLQVSPAQIILTFDNTPAGWIANIAGERFGPELGFNAATISSLQELPQRLLAEFNPLGAVLGVVGLLSLIYRRRWGLAAFTCFGFASIVLFDVSYHIGDIADFYTPAYLMFAIWISVALATVLRYVRSHTHLRVGLLPTIVLLVAAAALPVENFFDNFTDNDRSLQTDWRDRWDVILKSDLPQDAILISNDRDEMTPMWYLQLVERLRPDTLGLFPLVSQEPAYANVMRVVGSVINSGRPVYLIKSIPAINLRYALDSAPAGLLRVEDTPLPSPSFKSTAVLGNQLRVVGFSLPSGNVHPGTKFPVAVYWRPLVSLGRDYAASLQLFDDSGQKIAQGDDHKPGGDTYPTSLWQPKETLRDLFTITTPPGANPGPYQLFVRVYDPLNDDTLGGLTEIGSLEVSE